MMKNLMTATPKWDADRKYWKINIQRDRVRRSFYSSVQGRRGRAECMAKAQHWLDMGTDADPTLHEAMDEWLKSKKKTLSNAGYKTLETCSKRITDSPIYEKRLSRISPIEWQSILDKGTDDNLSAKYIGNIKSAIIELQRYCVRSRWLDKALTSDDLTVHSNKGKKVQVILQPDGIRTLFTSDRTEFYQHEEHEWYINFFRFAVITGMRRGEIAGLKWDDIHDNVISINRSLTNTGEITQGKTENAIRDVPLSPTIQSILDQQKADMKAKGIVSPWMFPDERGNASDTNKIFDAWKRYLKFNGLDTRITLHNLRRTMISMHKDDMPLELLKSVVGHSASMDTFGVYGRAMDGDLDKASQFMESSIQSIIAK